MSFKKLYFIVGLITLSQYGYCDGDTDVASSMEEASPVQNTSVNPQADSTSPSAQSPENILNPVSIQRINQDALNKGGIYPQSGALFIDRAVVLSNSLLVSSITVSSINVTGASQETKVTASSITVSSLNVTGLSQFSTITASSITVSNMNVTTGLQIPSGVNSADAANMANVFMYSLVCSSTTSTSTSNTTTAFVPTALGCSGALTKSSHHYFVMAKGLLEGTLTGAAYTAGLFYDGSNLDNGTYGQCDVQFTATGISLVGTDCFFLGYTTPGDTSSHTFKIYLSAASAPGGGTATFGNNALTMRMFVFETQ